MTRRANGEGSEPRLRADGRWQAMYTAADGRRRAVTMPKGSTKSQCRAAVAAARRNAEAGHRPVVARLTVGAWLDTWLSSYVGGGTRPKRPGTVASYTSVVTNHLRPRLGSIALARLTREDVQVALGGIEGTGVSASTTAHIFHILRIALNEAVRSEVVTKNVCLRVLPPQTHQANVTPWNAAEVNMFLDAAAGDRYAPLFTTAITTGLRQGELLGLQWSDVDWTAGTLRVERQLLRTGDFGEPKSAAGVRTLGLSPLTIQALRAQRTQQTKDRFRAKTRWSNERGLVFTTSIGTSPSTWAVWHAFHTASDGAGVRRIRFHDLCATPAPR